MSNDDPFIKSSLWRKKSPPPKKNPPSILPIVAGGVVVVLLLGLGGLAARASPPPTPTPAPTLVQATQTPTVATPTAIPVTATPTCTSAAMYLTVITDQEQQNKWNQAAENAASALNDPTLCKDDRPTLAQKYVTDAMEGLYAQPFDPSKAAQEELVTLYQIIVRNAAQYGAQVPRPLGVAQRAAQSGKFLLAKAAYDDAVANGSFNKDDIALIGSYADNLTSWGIWLTKDRTSTDFNEGITYLSAANQITKVYKTGHREAWGKLRELLGDNESKWPPPISTPLFTN